MKHYRTRLELTWDDKQYSKGRLEPAALVPVVSQWLAAHGLDPNTVYDFDATLDEWIRQRSLRIHLSISDEVDHALAFVVVESL